MLVKRGLFVMMAVLLAGSAKAAFLCSEAFSKDSERAQNQSTVFTGQSGWKIVYRFSGPAKPKARILFLNGIDKDMTEWDSMRAAIAEKYPDAAFAQVDLVGQGQAGELNRSKIDPLKSEISYSVQTALLRELIRKEGWDNENLVIIGHSYGGGIAARLNAETHGMVKEVVLVAPFVDFLETQQPGVGPFMAAQKMFFEMWGLRSVYDYMVGAGTETGMIATWLPYSMVKGPKSSLSNIIALTRGIRDLNMAGSVQNAGDTKISLIGFTHDEVVPPPAIASLWENIPNANRGEFNVLFGTHESPSWLPETVSASLQTTLDRVFGK